MEDEFEDEEKSNQIFNVKDAVPPNDFDAPYSQLPSSVQVQHVKAIVRKVNLGLAEEKSKEKAKMMAKVHEKAMLKQQKDADKGGLKLPAIRPGRGVSR